jgi:hypothetical protein
MENINETQVAKFDQEEIRSDMEFFLRMNFLCGSLYDVFPKLKDYIEFTHEGTKVEIMSFNKIRVSYLHMFFKPKEVIYVLH